MNNNIHELVLSDSVAELLIFGLFFILYLISVIFNIYTPIQHHSLGNLRVFV